MKTLSKTRATKPQNPKMKIKKKKKLNANQTKPPTVEIFRKDTLGFSGLHASYAILVHVHKTKII